MEDEFVLKNRVKDFRKARHMRQEDLAQGVGVARQTILAIEKGRMNPSVALSLKIARHLGESIGDVFYLESKSATKS